MADLKLVIKKMREEGISADEAKASLRELGFTNADALVDGIYGATAPAPESKPAEPAEAEGVEEGEGKELFGGEEKEEASAEAEEKPEVPEIPKLKITRVQGGEEKEVNIEEMLKTAAAGVEPAFTKTEAAGLKAKLDETISLLKALQEINKKILDAEKEVLMRLK